jgi:hypothetical protein
MDARKHSKIVQAGHNPNVNSLQLPVLPICLGTVTNISRQREKILSNTMVQTLLWSISKNNEVYHSCRMQ